MSKILIVEPHKMLQRAMALAFFPDHEVELTNTLPGASTMQNNYDLIIIDAASLREKNGLDDELSMVQSWPTPTIWVENPKSANDPIREKLLILRKPLSKHALLSAMADLIGAKTPEAASDSTDKYDDTRVAKRISDAAPDEESHAQESGIIELVDVVEEPSQETRENPRPRKKD